MTGHEEIQAIKKSTFSASELNTLEQEPKGEPQACLFVASLSSAKSEEQLHDSVTEHFQSFGPLKNVKVCRDWMNRPYAFVQFESVKDAKKALNQSHNAVIDGRHIRIEQARVNRTLFIARLGRYLNEQEIRPILEEYGPVEDFTLLKEHRTGQSRGCGFVKYAYREDAIKAFSDIKGSHKWAVEWASNVDRGDMEIDKKSIFVGQLNQKTVTNALLWNHFEHYGPIANIELVNRYPSGPSEKPAFAFVQFFDEESASAAVEYENGAEFLDRHLKVQYREVSSETSEVETPPMHYRSLSQPLPGQTYGYIANPYALQYYSPEMYGMPIPYYTQPMGAISYGGSVYFCPPLQPPVRESSGSRLYSQVAGQGIPPSEELKK